MGKVLEPGIAQGPGGLPKVQFSYSTCGVALEGYSAKLSFYVTHINTQTQARTASTGLAFSVDFRKFPNASRFAKPWPWRLFSDASPNVFRDNRGTQALWGFLESKATLDRGELPSTATARLDKGESVTFAEYMQTRGDGVPFRNASDIYIY